MKINKIIFSAMLWLGFTAFAGAQTNIEYEEFDLDNGLHVILHEDHSTPIVAVTVLYHVGSKNEDPKRTGFAHFFEHLLFEGSENIERGEFMSIVKENGGVLNANTTFDRTFYYEILPSNQLELGLWLESERMLHSKIDQEGVETQRGVVKEELRQRVTNRPYGSLLGEMYSHAYQKHPYQWIPIGSFEHINNATIEEFRDFYNTFYVPNNATVSIAGDINPKEAKKLVKKYFKDIPKGDKEIPRPDVVEPPQEKEVVDTIYDNIQLPAVAHGFHIPAQSADEYYAVDMLTTLLSQGRSSRFQKSIVDEQEKALFVGAFPIPTEDPGLAMMFGITNMGVDVMDLEKAMDEEYDRVRNELISEDEFKKLKNQVRTSFVNSNAKVSGIAESLANYYTYYGNTELINEEVDKYMNVTREDIKKAAQKYLVKKNRVTLYYLPKKDEQ